MNSFLIKIRNNCEGTALLVALLVMGVLIAISLALSSLIFREIGSTKELIESGKAYYAAESGIEEALYYLDANLPGWDTEDKFNIGEAGDESVYEYRVKNKCNSYPCFDEEDYDLNNIPVNKFYDVLELNETITIPLFTVKEGDSGEPFVDSVQDFTVEYYINLSPGKDLELTGVQGWDVLRWKIFGMRKMPPNGSLITESLHDFTAVSSVRNDTETTQGEYVTMAFKPSWFGTDNCSEKNDLRITDIIECIPYEPYVAGCTNLQSRDFYVYSQDGEFVHKAPCYDIAAFMDSHTSKTGGTGLNYITLTNLMNPSMIKSEYGEEQRRNMSRIYFRIETYDKDTLREFADIVSNGYSGDSKQSISVKIKKDSYMPVFNFSLYSTYKNEEEKDKYYDATIGEDPQQEAPMPGL